MNCLQRPVKRIKVCTGPNCRSWQSGKVLSLLWGLTKQSGETENIQICPVSCMKKCSGGVTVRMAPSGKLLKCREPEEALEALAQQDLLYIDRNSLQKSPCAEREQTLVR